MASPDKPQTRYLNVDLDVASSVPLEGLVAAMGPRVLVLHVGRHGTSCEAHVELGTSHTDVSPDKAIRGLVRIVERLPVRERRVWDSALSREFNIGIEAGLRPHAFEVRLEPSTVQALVGVGATVVVTVYAAVAGAPTTPPISPAATGEGRKVAPKADRRRDHRGHGTRPD